MSCFVQTTKPTDTQFTEKQLFYILELHDMFWMSAWKMIFEISADWTDRLTNSFTWEKKGTHTHTHIHTYGAIDCHQSTSCAYLCMVGGSWREATETWGKHTKLQKGPRSGNRTSCWEVRALTPLHCATREVNSEIIIKNIQIHEILLIDLPVQLWPNVLVYWGATINMLGSLASGIASKKT